METTIRTIEVPLPAGADANLEDIDALNSLFRAIIGLRFDQGLRGRRIRRALEGRGWSVACGLQWHVEARRGRDLEQACGRTLDEAFTSVWQVAGSGEPLEGTP